METGFGGMPRRTRRAVANRLERARARIEDRKNWTRFSFSNGYGQFCALGALTDGTHGSKPIEKRARIALGDFALGLHGTDIIGLNDHGPDYSKRALTPARSHRAVLDVYTQVINFLRSEEGE